MREGHGTRHARDQSAKELGTPVTRRRRRKEKGSAWHAPGHGRDQARAGPPDLLHGHAVLTVDYPPVTHGREEVQRLTAQHKTQHNTFRSILCLILDLVRSFSS